MNATMLDAKTNLSKYVSMVEDGEVDRVVLYRNKKPVAQISPLSNGGRSFTIGVAEGQFSVGDIDADNDVIHSMFYGE